MYKTARGLSFFVLTSVVVGMVFLLSGCPGPLSSETAPTASAVTDLGNIPEGDPAYILTLFNDEELVETLIGRQGVISILQDLQSQATEFGTKVLKPFSKSLGSGAEITKSLKQLGGSVPVELPVELEGIDAIIEWCEKEKTKKIVANARKLIGAVDKSLLTKTNRYDYCIEIKDKAKTRILQSFGKSDDSSPLFFDFRDAVFISSLLRTIVFVYDMKAFWEDLKNQTSTLPFNTRYLEFLESQNFSALPSVSSPYNVFDMNDVFVPSFLRFRGFGKMVDYMDKHVLYFKEIYDFEKQKTKDNGYRSDGRRTLYQLFFNEPQKISFVREAGEKTLADLGIVLSELGITSLKIGNLPVTRFTKAIDVIRKIDETLPSSVLAVELNYEMKNGFKLSGSDKIKFDFSKIASKDVFDFKNNNLGIKAGFFAREDVYQLIQTIIEGDVTDESVLLEFLLTVDEYADFFTITISGLKTYFDLNVVIEGGAIEISRKLVLEQS